MAPRRPLCVCGRSADPPYCDGSHRAEGWSCALDAPRHALAFAAATPRFKTLARKLASHFDAALVKRGRERDLGAIECLVVLRDGTELFDDAPPPVPAAEHVLAVGIGPASDGLPNLGDPAATLDRVALDRAAPPALFADVRDTVLAWRRGDLDGPPQRPRPRSAFISHAVADERAIVGVVDALRRHLGASLFVCADSIPAAGTWRRAIVDALCAADVFVLVFSQAAATSTFCAFEVGFACALDLPIHLVSLDGSPPPAYAQHIQMTDVPRVRRAHPWLDDDDVLLDALLAAVAT